MNFLTKHRPAKANDGRGDQARGKDRKTLFKKFGRVLFRQTNHANDSDGN